MSEISTEREIEKAGYFSLLFSKKNFDKVVQCEGLYLKTIKDMTNYIPFLEKNEISLVVKKITQISKTDQIKNLLNSLFQKLIEIEENEDRIQKTSEKIRSKVVQIR